MESAKRFFYVCAGVFLLALSYHLGAGTATAQAPSNPVVAADNGQVFTANGDIYYNGGLVPAYSHVGNIFTGGPTPAKQQSWGQMKARYR